MRRLPGLILFAVLVVSFSTCEIDRCLQSSGDTVTHIVELDSFKTAEIYDVFDVELVQDSVTYIEFVAGENVLKHIETVVYKDTVSIYNYNSCAWFKGHTRPLIRLHFDDINTVNILGSSYVYTTQPVTDDIRLVVKSKLAEADVAISSHYFFFLVYRSTGGRYSFTGVVDIFHSTAYYTSVCDASGLKAKEAKIKNYSVADYKVWVEEKINVELHNVGNIFIKGNPEVIIDSVSSTGKVLWLK